jgi:hypothetical protein
MSTKHTVTLPDGTIAKRTSANRVYPYAVAVGPAPKAEVLAMLGRALKAEKGYLARYERIVAYLENGGELVTKVDFMTSIMAPGLGANERALGYGNETREGILAKYAGYAKQSANRIVQYGEEIAETTEGPELIGEWTVSGWQSRAELAHKHRNHMQSVFPDRHVMVVETEYVTK